MPLRIVTYLAPSIPLEFYRHLAEHLAARLATTTTLVSDTRASGPRVGDDPFSAGMADIGFMCAPCFVALDEQPRSPVRLIEAAPLYDDPRCGGAPVYFSELVVRADSHLRAFSDLRGARWAYNDELSLSGFHSVLRALAERGLQRDFVGEARCAGSHLSALRAVSDGEVDFAAIDSNTLAIQRRTRPELCAAVRVIESLGPHPVQPVVARATLPETTVAALTTSLLQAHEDRALTAVFARNGLSRFVPVTRDAYTRATVFGDSIA